jgi:hypothetical protein
MPYETIASGWSIKKKLSATAWPNKGNNKITELRTIL